MTRLNLRKHLGAKVLLGAIVFLMVADPASAVLGVWRRTAVVVAATTSTAAAASANASTQAAAAASAQSAADASAAAAAQASAAATQSAAASAKSPQEQLSQLQSMLAQGLITQSDYDAAKAKILAGMTQ